jgi:hypothetical protein
MCEKAAENRVLFRHGAALFNLQHRLRRMWNLSGERMLTIVIERIQVNDVNYEGDEVHYPPWSL